MQNEISNLHAQTVKLLEAKREELEAVNTRIKDLKTEVLALEKIQKSFEVFGAPQEGGSKLKGIRVSVRNGQPTKVSKILDILKASDKAMDTGSIVRALGEEDNTKARTRVSGILGKLTDGPTSEVIKVAPGTFAARG